MTRAIPTPTTAAEESRWAVIRRRLVTVPVVLALFAALTLALPLVALVALAIDGVRVVTGGRRWMSLRVLAFGWAYLFAQVAGIVGLGAIWVLSGFGASRRAMQEWTYALQILWAAFLFRAVRTVFAIGLEVEGDEELKPGPILVLMRHASIIDTLLPNVLVTGRHGIRLRYVLKRELLVDPSLDIAGNRLPNCFVDRRSGDSAAEIGKVRGLTAGLTAGDGVLIYPEGTRFTEEKRRRILRRLREKDPAVYRRASQLHHTLPPRLGGSLALLDSLTPADVVFVAHVGLDGFARVKDVWRGEMVGSCIRVSFRRYPGARVPAGTEDRVAWLFDRWAEVDDWVGGHKGSR